MTGSRDPVASRAPAPSALRSGFAGEVHEVAPGEAPFWLPWRRNVVPKPGVVADPVSTGDVVRAVAHARDRGLDLAAQCGGHGAVRALPHKGLLLRTGALAEVEIDPRRRTARAGGGTRWGEVVTAAAEYGLAPVSGTSPDVGVAGYTLGGGLGWLTRRHGFAADNLLSAEVVTADARALRVSADTHEDLFWALRGGGGNFGVVTELEMRLHPIGRISGGVLFFPFERAHAILDAYRSLAHREPEDVVTAVVLVRPPDSEEVPEPLRGRPVVALRVCVLSQARDAARHVDRLLSAAGPPLLGGLGPLRFPELTALSDPQPLPQVSEEHTDLFDALPDTVVDELVSVCEHPDSPVSVVEVRNWTGAPGRPPADAGPAGHRNTPFSVIAIAPGLNERTLEGARSAMARLAARLAPHATGSVFLNFLSDPGRVAAAYPPEHLGRLRELKRRFDPDNVFHLNHNIRP